jgi:hypothetical protein
VCGGDGAVALANTVMAAEDTSRVHQPLHCEEAIIPVAEEAGLPLRLEPIVLVKVGTRDGHHSTEFVTIGANLKRIRE